MDRAEINAIVQQIKCLDYTFTVEETNGIMMIQGGYSEEDTYTKQPSWQKTRKWVISAFAVKSEVVQTVLKLVLTSLEHRAREAFLYKNERVFGPHFDVEALVEIAKEKRLEYRKTPNPENTF